MAFQLDQISANVYSILENDARGCNPYIYLIDGTEKVLVIDTGCDTEDLYLYIRTLPFGKEKKIIVVNTHNHPEQTGGNYRFSTTGKHGLSLGVENLCASAKSPKYTKLLDSSWHWQVQTYKVTKWLDEGSRIFLGDESDPKNVVHVFCTPGHTPDSLVLWYPYNNRLFIGDMFYRFSDVVFTSDYSCIREFDDSLRRIIDFCKQQPANVRYSSARIDNDNACLPVLKHFLRFFLNIVAGSQHGNRLRIDDAAGWRYESRDKSMRVVLARHIVDSLRTARAKATVIAGAVVDSDERSTSAPSLSEATS